MPTLRTLIRARRTLNFKDYKQRAASEADFTEVLREPFQLISGGQLVMVYVELGDDLIAAPPLSALRAALPHVKYTPRDRSSGMIGYTRTFGYQPRMALRHDFCTQAGLALEMPDVHACLEHGADVVSEYYARYAPHCFAAHEQIAARVRPEYHLRQTPFTSGIINQSNPLPYHFDAGNFPDVWSGMLTFREAHAGGYLCFPEFRLAIQLSDKSLLMFDGQSTLHGVTPIRLLSDLAMRYTVVYYSLKGMWKCASNAEEVQRIRRLRTTREQRRVTSSSLAPSAS